MEHEGEGGEGGDHTCPINARVGRVNGSCQIPQTENIKNWAGNQLIPLGVFTDNKERLWRDRIS